MPSKLTVSPYDPELKARKCISVSVPFLAPIGHTYTEDLDTWLAGRSITQLAAANSAPLGVLVQHILLKLHPALADVWPQATWSKPQRNAFIARRKSFDE